jgi:hypothetical protein
MQPDDVHAIQARQAIRPGCGARNDFGSLIPPFPATQSLYVTCLPYEIRETPMRPPRTVTISPTDPHPADDQLAAEDLGVGSGALQKNRVCHRKARSVHLLADEVVGSPTSVH